MKEDVCILCGRPFPTGLHVMGCLICFPCEKELLSAAGPVRNRRRLSRLYGPLGAGKKTSAVPLFREQNRALIR